MPDTGRNNVSHTVPASSGSMVGMKTLSFVLLLTFTAVFLDGCAIVPLEPYGPPRHEHGGYGYHEGHGHRDWR